MSEKLYNILIEDEGDYLTLWADMDHIKLEKVSSIHGVMHVYCDSTSKYTVYVDKRYAKYTIIEDIEEIFNA